MNNKLFLVYKNLPVTVQNLLCSIYGYKLNSQRYGKNYQNYFDFLISSDSWEQNKILEYKEEHLDKIIRYAYRHCPYYKSRFKQDGLSPDDFKGIESLKKFPVLTKEDVRANYLGMLSDEFDRKQLIPYHTSGSTGKALDFFWTKENLQFYWATVWRGRHRFGIRRGVNFTGKLVVPIEQITPPYWRYNKPINQCIINMQHITREKIPVIIDFLNCTDFKFIVGYPSIINSLAVMADEFGLLVSHSPQYIFSSAEKMYENQKNAILSLFPKTKIVEHYGFSENAACASKCKSNVYHEDFELGHLELKNPVSTIDGVTGQMLATGFQNFAMPFIRYEMGDTATFSSRECDCGMKSQVILDIEGRNEDYIITPEGTHIMRCDYIFKDSKDIRECQIVQRELGSIVIRVVKRDSYSVRTEKDIRTAVNELLSPRLKVNFEYVDMIPRTKSGKFKAVVSEINK